VENSREAVVFYKAAFGAEVLHLVGEGDDIVAQHLEVARETVLRSLYTAHTGR
jgi:uncharacterized glyoxalase superfamily protein PhnB